MQLPDHLSRQGDWIIACDKALVLQVEQWTESTVSGSGGGGFTVNGYGGTNSVNVSTRHDRYIRMWLRYENGQEAEFKFSNSEVSVRAGQIVLLFWKKPVGGGDKFKLYEIFNPSTGDMVNVESDNVFLKALLAAIIVPAMFGMSFLVYKVFPYAWVILAGWIAVGVGLILNGRSKVQKGHQMAQAIIDHLGGSQTLLSAPVDASDIVIVSEGNS